MAFRTPGLLPAAIVCALAAPASAQSSSAQSSLMAVITTGTLQVSTSSTRPQITLGAGIVDVGAAFDDGSFEAEACRPCLLGDHVGIGGRITAEGKGNAFYEGDFTITGEPIEVPSDAGTEVVLTGAFSFRGQVVRGTRRDAPPDSKEPAVDLEGGGTVTVTLTSTVDPDTGARLFFFRDVTYQFSPTGR